MSIELRRETAVQRAARRSSENWLTIVRTLAMRMRSPTCGMTRAIMMASTTVTTKSSIRLKPRSLLRPVTVSSPSV